MEFSDFFPVWDKLSPVQQERLRGYAMNRTVTRGTVELTDRKKLEELQDA